MLAVVAGAALAVVLWFGTRRTAPEASSASLGLLESEPPPA